MKHENEKNGVKSVIHLMDNMELMKQYPDNHFELAIVDPEYGIGASSPSDKPCIVKQRNGSFLNVDKPKYMKKQWDKTVASGVYFDELIRVSKHQIIWGCNYYNYIFGSGRIAWNKLNGESDQLGCEIAYNSTNTRTDIVNFMWAGMMQGLYIGFDTNKALKQQGNKALNEKRIHPTQKPVKLYEWLLMNYAKEGDKILDTHLGSGSSRIAAYNLRFDFTGCELDEDYFNDHVKRFEQHIKQLKLF